MTGKPVGEAINESISKAEFSTDRRWIITISSNALRLWDAESGKPLCEPLRGGDEGQISATVLFRDGRRIGTISNGVAQLWDIAVDLDSPLPLWVTELAEALGGRRLDEGGVFVPAGKSVLALRGELLASTGDDFWSRLGRWFFMREPERMLGPDSKLTTGELERLLDAGQKSSGR
jgi:WD40 repeat protein